MSEITITHSPRTGTVVVGTVKGDGASPILSRRAWGPSRCQDYRSSDSIGENGGWYLPNSRNKRSYRFRPGIDQLAGELRAIGHTVTVTIDDTDTLTVAERELAAIDNAEARAERFGGYAATAERRSEELLTEAERRRKSIPPGQPLLVDHYSYNRELKFRERTHKMEGQGLQERDRGRYWTRRQQAAAHYADHRFHPRAIIGRIETLEAEQRTFERHLDRALSGSITAEPAQCEEWQAEIEDLRERIAFWREQLAAAEEEGVKIWRPQDFTPGDFAQVGDIWYEVLKVNAKTLTVPTPGHARLAVVTRADGRRGTRGRVEYRNVHGRLSAEEMARQRQQTGA